MGAFDFVFSLYSILLGLSLVEVLSGLARVLKHRTKVRLGWLTPMLGVFVMLDLTSFWSSAWSVREHVAMSYGALVLGLIFSSIYYIAASLVFPDLPHEWPDLDAYYLKFRRRILGAVWLCNVPFILNLSGADKMPLIQNIALGALYWLLVGMAVATGNKRANGVALAGLIALYLYYAVR